MAEKKRRPNRIDTGFLDIAPKDRKNSQTIRRLIFDTIAHEFDHDCDRASTELGQATQSSDRRAYDRPIPANSFRRVVRDEVAITFQHLNALAKYYNIPISVMLLFTRIRDELESVEQRQNGEAARILDAFNSAVEFLKTDAGKCRRTDRDIVDMLGHRAFKQFAESYREALNTLRDEPQLPIK